MDKIDRVIKIISEAKVTSSEDRPSSSSPQDAAKQRALAQREKQKKLLGKIKERQADRKKYVPQKSLENISQSIKKAKFSKLNKVSDRGEKGVTAMGKTAGNAVRAVGNIAKVGAKVARKGIKGIAKASTAVSNEVRMSANRGELRSGLGGRRNPVGRTVDKSVSKVKTSAGNMLSSIKQRAKDKFKAKPGMFRSVKEEFIQEVEDKKDKVDKVIDIMRGKNKIKINPDVKESVDKT